MSDDAWRMSAEDAEEYTRALGQIMSGGWRQIALAQRLGVPAAIGMTNDDWVRERIGGYVRLGLDERRGAVKELTDPEGEFRFSNRQAADVLGVDEGTVRNDRKGAENSAPEREHLGGPSASDAENSARDGWAEPTVEPGLADIDWESPDPDEDEDEEDVAPETEPTEPRERTIGDAQPEIARALEESGAFEKVARIERANALRGVRMGWLRFTRDYRPEEVADGIGVDELQDVVGQIDMMLDWLMEARVQALNAQGPRRMQG